MISLAVGKVALSRHNLKNEIITLLCRNPDKFEVQGKDIGIPARFYLKRDDGGKGADWYVDWVWSLIIIILFIQNISPFLISSKPPAKSS